MASGTDQPDFLDLLPDPVLLLILNRVSDIKTLLRCRSVSRRLAALVPLADSLLLRVDRVIPASHDGASSLLKFLLTTFYHLISPAAAEDPNRLPNSPSRILRGFDAIKRLRIELPATDLRPDNGTTITWVARFGQTLQSCVILAPGGGGGGLKTRVVWTISALIAASSRHYMAADVINEQRLLSHLIVCDRENEGTMIMDKDGLREFRERIAGGGVWWRNNRTMVPAVGMRMRYEPKLELSNGVVMEGATLVVVKPVGERRSEAEETYGDEALAAEAFWSGVYAEAVEKLLKSRSYILEMNSF